MQTRAPSPARCAARSELCMFPGDVGSAYRQWMIVVRLGTDETRAHVRASGEPRGRCEARWSVTKGWRARRVGKIRTCGIERVDVDAQVYRVFGADAIFDLLDDAARADGVDFARLDDFEAAVAVVLVVAGSRECGADSGVDVGVVCQ